MKLENWSIKICCFFLALLPILEEAVRLKGAALTGYNLVRTSCQGKIFPLLPTAHVSDYCSVCSLRFVR